VADLWEEDMHTTMRRLAVALAAAGLLVAAGCAKDEAVTTSATTAPVTASSGDDEGTTTTTEEEDEDPDADEDKGSGDYDEVCEKIEELDSLPDDTPDDEGLALMEEARDVSPDELVDHWDVLIDVLTELSALDEESDEAITRVFELMEDPEFLEAAATIDDFAEEECGLDIELDPTEEEMGGLSDPSGSSSSGGFEDVGEGDSPSAIDAVQDHLRDLYSEETWYAEALDENTSWSASGSSTITWLLVLGNDPFAAGMTEDDLLDVCDSMGYFLDGYEDGSVELSIEDGDGAVLASRGPGEDCAAA
jgi:hypothetical protein